MKSFKIYKVKGAASFNELLLVLAAVGILATMAWMNYDSIIVSIKASEAKTQLKGIAGLQTQHRHINSKYSMNFGDILFDAPKTVNEGGSANYAYEIIEATNTSFRARATAVVDFNGDGQFNVWEIDENQKPTEITSD